MRETIHDKRTGRRIAVESLTFAQILSAPFKGDVGGLNHSIYGLTTDGRVYRYVRARDAWEPLPAVAVVGVTR